MLGGSAVHFSLAASFFDTSGGRPGRRRLRRGGVRGRSAPAASTPTTSSRCRAEDVLLAGEYERDLNDRETLDTQLGVFEDFEPKLSEASRAADVLFLANIQPDLQREVRAQCPMRGSSRWTR